jgi:hypothetical protein
MRKKFFFVGTLALLGASLFIIGCRTGVETETRFEDVLQPIDAWATAADLQNLLNDSRFETIGVKTVLNLTVPITVPSDKTLVLYSDINVVLGGLTVKGTVIIGEAGGLIASTSGIVTVEGSLKVLEGGTLSVDTATSVNNGTSGTTALGTKATINGGVLKYLTIAGTGANTIKTSITTALSYVDTGTLDVGIVSLKLSDLNGYDTLGKTLKVTANGGVEGPSTEITIPAGLDVTIGNTGQPMANITKLTVNGTLAGTAGVTLVNATEITVNNGGVLDFGTTTVLYDLPDMHIPGISTSGSGVIKSAMAAAQLESLLRKAKAGGTLNIEQGGTTTVTLNATTVEVQAGTTLTMKTGLMVPGNKNLTVNGTLRMNKTLEIAVNGGVELTTSKSKVIFNAGSSLDVKTNLGRFGEATPTNTKITVAAASASTIPTLATVSGGGTNMMVTTGGAGTNLSNSHIVLGTLALDFDGTNPVAADSCLAAGSPVAARGGTLTAGTGTVITFTGTD